MDPTIEKSTCRRIIRRSIGVWLFATFISAWLNPAQAQQPKKNPRIGVLTLDANPDPLELIFLQGLRDLGYDEGRNITIEYRRAAGKVESLPQLAEELVRLKVDLIVVRATPVVQAAKNATSTIPIVMMGVGDPVRSGFVASLARPGGNITGMSAIMPELAGKRLELLREIRPKLSRVAFLAYRPDPLHTTFVKDAQEAAERLKIKIWPAVIGTVDEIEAAFSTMNRERAEALIVQPLFGVLGQRQRITNLAMKNRLPTISDGRAFAEAGALLSYGPDQRPMFQRAATFVDKILKGTKPADLPVEQPTKFEFVINLKTAKALNLTIPQSVLFRADKVIQ
jgi:putative ABC transport system substrate-binding protein